MLATTKILIHSDYGAYGFSDEFQKSFIDKYGIDIYSITHYDPYFDQKNTNEFIETRYDPRVIDVFEQLGPEKSNLDGVKKFIDSSTIGSQPLTVRKNSLKIVEIPTILLDAFYISAYDGAEWVWCNTSKKYKELLFSGIRAKMSEKMEILRRCEAYLTEKQIHYV